VLNPRSPKAMDLPRTFPTQRVTACLRGPGLGACGFKRAESGPIVIRIRFGGLSLPAPFEMIDFQSVLIHRICLKGRYFGGQLGDILLMPLNKR